MAVFIYKAKSKDGKVINGKIESRDKREAVRELSKLDLSVYQVKPVSAFLNKDLALNKSIKDKDFVIFLRQFATLMQAGVLLISSIELLSQQTGSKLLQETLTVIAADIREGSSLSSCMARYPKVFPELLVQMVHTGEISGRLDEVIEQMAEYYEKQYRIKQKVSTALTYPTVVGSFAIVITIFLLLFIIPIFASMYTSMDSELPTITKAVMALSDFLWDFWWLLLLLIIAIVFLLKQFKKGEKGRYYMDLLSLKVPVLGNFKQKAALARMTRTLSSLLSSSVPILEAVEIAGRVAGNRVIEDVLLESQKSLEQGDSLSKPMEGHWVFPPLILHMIRVGEESGALDSMLKRVADIYEQEVNEASDKLQSLIEPILIIFLAIIVGVLVLSIIVPMFGMFQQF